MGWFARTCFPTFAFCILSANAVYRDISLPQASCSIYMKISATGAGLKSGGFRSIEVQTSNCNMRGGSDGNSKHKEREFSKYEKNRSFPAEEQEHPYRTQESSQGHPQLMIPAEKDGDSGNQRPQADHEPFLTLHADLSDKQRKKNQTCRIQFCNKVASFGWPGTSKYLYCATHRFPGRLHVHI